MHHDKLFTAFAIVLLVPAVGCSSAHEPLSATSGVYDLTIASESDPCSPMRVTGPAGTAAVTLSGSVLALSAPDLTTNAPMLVWLNGDAGYSQTQTTTLETCTAATLERAYTVVGTNAGGFDVAYRETWSGLSTCGAAMRSIMPAAPRADCSADLVLHYHLADACTSPCQIRVAADGSAACHC